MFNLPEKVIFCKECVMSNQKPNSIPEFNHTVSREGAKYMNINEDGICDACKYHKIKNQINWKEREDLLLKLLDKFRKNDGSYDCLVPGSGGKDSVYQSHILKTKYGMNPLTTTWPPILYTEYGLKNFYNWINVGGFDNVTFNPNGDVKKILTKLSILNLLHPFQTFILGQKNLAPKVAKKYDIKLIFYGENEAEYGNPIADNELSLRDKSFYTMKNVNDKYLAGVKISDLINNYNITHQDLSNYLPMEENEFQGTNIEIHYLGYYLKWIPQEAYYYAVKHTNFQPRPFRTQGTYSKYNSIDDKIDDLHYYTTFIKYGIGRTTYDASQEIRNGHIDREEAKMLVQKYDGEFPGIYFREIMDYLDIETDLFHNTCNKFRPNHLWDKINDGKYKLKFSVNSEGN